MDLLDRLLGHDAWTTRQLLECCRGMGDEAFDLPFEIGRGTLRATFVHIVRNMEVWSGVMDGSIRCWSDVAEETPGRQTVEALMGRLEAAADRLARVSRRVREEGAWDETWVDVLESPPRLRTYAGAIGHVITHSMHHRGQVMYMLRRLGVERVPEGDVLGWEEGVGRA